MKIEHVALWVKDIEAVRKFYMEYFDAVSYDKYVNNHKSFQSYFLSFSDGARLELMQRPDIPEKNRGLGAQSIGFIHMAFSVGSKDRVLIITERLRADGYMVVSEPRTTGDGYFESCILDIENNRIEIMI